MSMHSRRIPGAGDFDLDGVLTVLLPRLDGQLPPISVEVISDTVVAMQPREAAAALYAGAVQTMNAAAIILRRELGDACLERMPGSSLVRRPA